MFCPCAKRFLAVLHFYSPEKNVRSNHSDFGCEKVMWKLVTWPAQAKKGQSASEHTRRLAETRGRRVTTPPTHRTASLISRVSHSTDHRFVNSYILPESLRFRETQDPRTQIPRDPRFPETQTPPRTPRHRDASSPQTSGHRAPRNADNTVTSTPRHGRTPDTATTARLRRPRMTQPPARTTPVPSRAHTAGSLNATPYTHARG